MGQVLVAAVSILAGIGEFATWIRSLLDEKPAPDQVPLPPLSSHPISEPAPQADKVLAFLRQTGLPLPPAGNAPP